MLNVFRPCNGQDLLNTSSINVRKFNWSIVQNGSNYKIELINQNRLALKLLLSYSFESNFVKYIILLRAWTIS